MTEIRLSAGEVRGLKARLGNLREHLPDHSPAVHNFGAFLAPRLNSLGLRPEGFSLAAVLALEDLANRYDSINERPLEHELAGLDQDTYDEIKLSVPIIAHAVAPPEFAEQVARAFEELRRREGRMRGPGPYEGRLN